MPDIGAQAIWMSKLSIPAAVPSRTDAVAGRRTDMNCAGQDCSIGQPTDRGLVCSCADTACC